MEYLALGVEAPDVIPAADGDDSRDRLRARDPGIALAPEEFSRCVTTPDGSIGGRRERPDVFGGFVLLPLAILIHLKGLALGVGTPDVLSVADGDQVGDRRLVLGPA
jgi:hypothetical protein